MTSSHVNLNSEDLHWRGRQYEHIVSKDPIVFELPLQSKDELRKARNKHRRLGIDESGKCRANHESTAIQCVVLMDEKPMVNHDPEYVRQQGDVRVKSNPVATVAFKYPQYGWPEIHLAFAWSGENVDRPFAHATIHCNRHELFCNARGLPKSEDEDEGSGTAVLFNIFVDPEAIDFHVSDAVASELQRRLGSAAVQAFHDVRSRLQNLEHETKFEFICTSNNRIPATSIQRFTDSWAGELEDPLAPLAANAMKSYKFTRGNMLPPSEVGFTGHDPAKMRFSDGKERSAILAYATYYEQLYDKGTHGNLEAQTFQSRAFGLKESKVDGEFTEYLFMVKVDNAKDMQMMPRPGKEDFEVQDGTAVLFNRLLSKCSGAEIVRDLVDVRTIPLVQGHEADLVIFDTVRTTSLGFLAEHSNVCLTRAKYGLIVVGSSQCWMGASAGAFQNLKSYFVDRDAVRTYKKPTFALDCARCHEAHATKDCKWQANCPNCPEQPDHHHVRNCKKEGVKLSETLPAGHQLVLISEDKWAKRDRYTVKKMARNLTMLEMNSGTQSDASEAEDGDVQAEKSEMLIEADKFKKMLDEVPDDETEHKIEEPVAAPGPEWNPNDW
ncbi:hypothetical protein PG990_002467 [Apiospora arundinis]